MKYLNEGSEDSECDIQINDLKQKTESRVREK